MTHDLKKIAVLRRISQASWEMEQARLGALNAEEAALREKLDSLDRGRKSRAAELNAGPDAARLAGADPLWENWIDSRRAAMMSELARIRARKEAAREKFGRAYGRKEAIAEIEARVRAQNARKPPYS
ncbi:hypothetical protein [Roseisalinus antarcticus]|uniref:Flagellar FliJ protein n=1 Tax=Roseisalinus antarcticus TaxID=254357 RepID=A0A1Y5TFT2_9RHOB|nr:hypothetical protein [Roseisalinus antarcticus]SLN62755.1 hypothetical protein ROA7023_02931 [Roseisalinus antarcticus]